jgi:hypothetical protein
MELDYLEEYKKIVGENTLPNSKYNSPDEQGKSIRKCSILEHVKIEYSNTTTLRDENRALK